MAEAAHLDVMPFGLVGYPVLQAADILLPRADLRARRQRQRATRRGHPRDRATLQLPVRGGVPRARSHDQRSPDAARHGRAERCPSRSTTPSSSRTLRRPSDSGSCRCTPIRTASGPTYRAPSKAIPFSCITTRSIRTAEESTTSRRDTGDGSAMSRSRRSSCALETFLQPIRERRAAFAAHPGPRRGDPRAGQSCHARSRAGHHGPRPGRHGPHVFPLRPAGPGRIKTDARATKLFRAGNRTPSRPATGGRAGGLRKTVTRRGFRAFLRVTPRPGRSVDFDALFERLYPSLYRYLH